MKSVAIIPAYNEEESLGEVILKTKKYVDLVIVINDGSTDKTEEVAKKSGATIYTHQINRGLGPTIIDGYREALRAGADIIVQIDADGQYLAEDIPTLMKPIIEGRADMVLGSRLAGKIEEMPAVKKIGNRLFSKMTGFLSNAKITDAQTGFRAMRRELLESIIPTGQYTYTQEMIIRSSKEGYMIVEVPIYFAKRKYGQSRLISGVFLYGLAALSIIIRTYREYHPMIFFGIPGAFLVLLGIIFGGFLVNVYITLGTFSGYTATVMLTALLIISGSLLIFLGMLADMIQSKYMQIREHFKRIGTRTL